MAIQSTPSLSSACFLRLLTEQGPAVKSSKLSILLFSYLLFICVWFLLWLTVGDGPWWLTVLNRVVPYLFLPVLLFLAWLLLKREYKLAVVLALPTLIFLLLYRPYLVPSYSSASHAPADLTVMTYNVLYSNLEYEAVSRNIRAYQPDLVALQEVVPAMMDALEIRLADDYPYSMHGTNGEYGVTAVFSRYPFFDTKVLDLGEDRRAVIVKAEVNDRTIVFAAVHLRAYGLQWVRPLTNVPHEIINRTNLQNHQVELLLDELLDEPGLAIIGCDCNSKETSSSYRMLDRQFDSAAYRVGWQIPGIELAGAKQDLNLNHIDFVWYRGELDPFAVYEIADTAGSDHHPVLALFELQ